MTQQEKYGNAAWLSTIPIMLFATALLFGSFLILHSTQPVAAADPSSGPTFVPPSIDEPTTWTLDLSPYVIPKNTRVQINSILSIEPGVVVKFDALRSQAKYSGLQVNGPVGKLVAQGTLVAPIIFTSVYDNDHDQVVGLEAAPVRGDWRGILFKNDDSSSSMC